jgi:hypothetical protein
MLTDINATPAQQIFALAPNELASREVDKQDFTDASLLSSDDQKDEASDPCKFHSLKTGRGPLVPGEWQVRIAPCAVSLAVLDCLPDCLTDTVAIRAVVAVLSH